MNFSSLPNSGFIAHVREVSKNAQGKAACEVGYVRLFDALNRSTGAGFFVRYDFGGNRMCLSRDGSTVLCGCYCVYGLGAYDVSTGKELWRRKDLKRVQDVQPLFHDDLVFCGREGSSGQIISITTGDTVQTLRGIKKIYASPHSSHVLLIGKDYQVQSPPGTKRFRIEPESFAVIDSAFSHDVVVVVEAAGHMRAFSLTTGKLLWRQTPTEGLRWMNVEATDSGSFVANLVVDARPSNLGFFVHLDAITGNRLNEVPFPANESGCYCMRGKAFFGSSNCLWSSETGQSLHRFELPAT
jgi:outer membrane protein assembly factor BamB